MKRVLIAAVVSLSSLAGAQIATASTINFTDTFNPPDVFFDGQNNTACTGTNGVTDTTSASTCKSLVYTHVLSGFNSLTDTLSSATLTLTLYNDASDGPDETYALVIDLLSFPSNASEQQVPDNSTSGSPYLATYDVLTQLADGTINVTLTSENGNHDFYFGQSVLTASGTRQDTNQETNTDQSVAPVPEPTSMLLLGSGLAGLAARRKNRRK